MRVHFFQEASQYFITAENLEQEIEKATEQKSEL